MGKLTISITIFNSELLNCRTVMGFGAPGAFVTLW